MDTQATMEDMAKKLTALIRLVPENPNLWTTLDINMNDLFVDYCGRCAASYGNLNFINALVAAGCTRDVAEYGVNG